MLKEFKEFAMRGSVLDMAIGIIIGAAFGKIVSSFLLPPFRVPPSSWRSATSTRPSLPGSRE
jgi:hypothetical protein